MSATTMPKAGRSAARRVQPQRVPRRVSGPTTGRAAARPSPHRSPTVGARALSVVRSLPDHSLLDRLVRGRAWIPVLGVLLAGIVATQVEILKLGTSLGRSLERTTTLQSTNESLQANIASLDDAGRIERLATRMGLITPSASLVTFLPTRPEGQLGQAVANIHPPDPAGFAQLLQSQIAAAELQAPPTTTASPATASLTAGQSTGVAGSSTPTGSTTTGATGTGSPGTTSAGLGSTGTGTTAGATTTAGGTAAAGATTTAGGGTDTAGGTPTVAPAGAGTTGTGTTSPGVTTGGGGGAAPAGGAGLPATTSSQSGTTTGG